MQENTTNCRDEPEQYEGVSNKECGNQLQITIHGVFGGVLQVDVARETTIRDVVHVIDAVADVSGACCDAEGLYRSLGKLTYCEERGMHLFKEGVLVLDEPVGNLRALLSNGPPLKIANTEAVSVSVQS